MALRSVSFGWRPKANWKGGCFTYENDINRLFFRSRRERVSSQTEARLVIPALAPFYESVSKLSYPLVRLAAGGVLLVHGVTKLISGPTPVIGSMARLGIAPPTPFAYWIIFLETFGALAIIFGLFTRFFAVCLAVEMAVIALMSQFPHGFSASKGGYEMTLMWFLIFVAIAFRGGGSHSLDRKIGWQL
jgi:putative oxidoreductase